MMVSDSGGPPVQLTMVPLSEDTFSVSVVRVEVRLSLLVLATAASNMNPSSPKGCRVLEEVVTICVTPVAG